MQNNKHRHLAQGKNPLAPRTQRGFLMLAITLLALLGAAFYCTSPAHAGTVQPVIHWDGAMIYPGQNNGYPEGPVGETAVVHGENFTALAGQTLQLALVAGNINTDPTLCQSANIVQSVGNVTPSASGTFDANFSWPAKAGQVNQAYSICSFQTGTNAVASSLDDGPFTVLSASKPTLSISASSVAPGGSITVSGQNWVPPQPLNIDIAGCADCDPGNSTIATTTTSSTGLNSGTFSISVPISGTAAPGNYVVNVFSQSGPLDAFHLPGVGIQHLVVTAPPAVTPTVSPSPSATTSPTASTTPTATTNSTPSTSTNNNSSGNNTPLLIGVLIALVVLLIAIAGIIFYMLSQRNKQNVPPSPSTNYPRSGPFQQYNASGGPLTPFPPSSMSQQGQSNQPPSYGYPSPNQQAWQGNPQSQQSFNQRCMRCGNVLSPDSAICGRCGLHNTALSDPNDPTIAY